MNDLWQSLPREDCGIRRMNGAKRLLLFALAAAVMTGGFVWFWI